jgi:DNA-binding ferritin-like protein (Dps family)
MNKFVSKVVGEKRQWREHKARTRQLPVTYRTALEALERYLMHVGPGGDGADAASMFDDLLDLFEQSAANRTPIREIVGEDPVEFLETFVQNYPDGQWRLRERKRLTSAIDRAAAEATGKEERVVS